MTHLGTKVPHRGPQNEWWVNGWYHPHTIRQMVWTIEVGWRVVDADWRSR